MELESIAVLNAVTFYAAVMKTFWLHLFREIQPSGLYTGQIHSGSTKFCMTGIMELNCEECAPKADLMQMLKCRCCTLHLNLAELEKGINTFAALAFGSFTFMIHISGILTDMATTEKGVFCSCKFAFSDVWGCK